MRESVWKSKVNTLLSFLFVGSFTLGALLIVWHVAFGNNPFADLIYKVSMSQTAGGF